MRLCPCFNVALFFVGAPQLDRLAVWPGNPGGEGSKQGTVECGCNSVSLSLSPFRIHSVSARSLVKLDNLQKVELQFNRLDEFSLGAFENCTKYPNSPMTLNISHNSIRHLTPMSNNRVPFIQV